MKYDVIIVGAGFAGSVLARQFAEDNKTVLVIDKRAQIAGNMYDYIDEKGVRVHKYGPHILHTTHKAVIEYLSRFTQWYPYEHRVLGSVQEQFVPVPFNLTSIKTCFSEDVASRMIDKLVSLYGMEKKVPILKLRENEDEDIKVLADFIFEHVFKYYTMKQWGLTVEELDPNVTSRVPVHISYDDRYFQDTYQQMPKEGYTKLFENMLNHPNITIKLNTEAKELIDLDWDKHLVKFKNDAFNGVLIYTGAMDEFADYRFGALPYRSLEFDLKSYDSTQYAVGTVNYPTPVEKHAFTRITEYKHLMEHQPQGSTCAVEYPYAYDRNAEKGNIPYYPVFTEENQNLYNKYVDAFKDFKSIYFAGRLAEYKYYNMDAIIFRALDLYKKINEAKS